MLSPALHGESPVPEPVRTPSRNDDRIGAEQVRTLMRNCPVAVMGAGTGAIILAIAFDLSGRVRPDRAWLWAALMIGCVLSHLALCVAYRRARPADGAWRIWLRLFTLIAACEGATWFVGANWLTSPNDLLQELMVLLVYSAIASGSLPTFGTHLAPFSAFFYPVIMPHLGFSLIYQYEYWNVLAVLLVAYIVAMTLIARHTNAQFIEGLQLRFENVDLVEGLRIAKADAEHANVAKSSFLAAASHDLRQPIHALGLFVGALENCTMDAEARGIVARIEGAVAAMDDLFLALLDISKLDAAAVTPAFQAVPLAQLLERIAQDYRGEAAEKRIGLRLRTGGFWVRSDPVLLERIVRNILSNAVRYTDRGGVLMGCRAVGDQITVEIWDTGRGIAEDQQARIFEEFYQIDNPERDRSRGLGLGLAIVRRLTDLLDCRLSMRSQPHRGTVFRLVLPRTNRPNIAPPDDPPAPQADSHQETILIIDDEAAIRQAMATVLASWGYRTLVAGSADEMLALLASDHARPALLVCDYRLRAGATGAEAVMKIRSYLGRDIPALLVTGDTAPDRIAEAMASGLVLLHKPVQHGRLRAAIGNLLRADAR
ncbi:ATP-binding response regulator [Sphingomonas nostoxanthinifaciens]|uniref:ATP-binding response regulator n=1 Tax=Sphingomonas nostoxanthinifaciens TaxID=2872652 RepID=UPI001CC1E6FC|nr:ATP-binding protein [Sphingomonas nostoxanthinifaciens]UAK25761.1 response regulator [Sphingomonas nostoxanthinifaciens]